MDHDPSKASKFDVPDQQKQIGTVKGPVGMIFIDYETTK